MKKVRVFDASIETQYPIRILCVFSTLDRGGAETMCMNLYRNIDREYIQFDFVKHSSDIGVYEDEIHKLGGRIFVAPRFTITNIAQYQYWWWKHLKAHPEHQIIHGHYFTISAFYFQVAKKMGRITVGHIHASGFNSRIRRLFVSRISKYTDYPIACSNEAGRWVYGSTREFIVLKNALDIDEFQYDPIKRNLIRESLNLREELTIGTVANYSEVKNPMGLIDIVTEVKKKIPSIKLIWIGDGDLRNEIEDRILKEGLENNIILLGIREDVSDLLQAMDVFLLVSFSEGLPLSVIEAQAAGLHCLLSDKITKEVDVTGLCSFISIDDKKEWVDHICTCDLTHMYTEGQIRKAGYDIHLTSEWLQRFYIGVIKRN